MRRTVAKDENGATNVEYLVLVVMFGLPVVGSLIFLGLSLLNAYHRAQVVLTGPIA
jgi:Flp pilus assembly pilin Flp